MRSNTACATFGGVLDHRILVTRYSGGDDIVALTVGADGRISRSAGVPGMSGLNNPVDLTEDPASGNLYVSELGAKRITLLRVPAAAAAAAQQQQQAQSPSEAAPPVAPPAAVSVDQTPLATAPPTDVQTPPTPPALPPVRLPADLKLIHRVTELARLARD